RNDSPPSRYKALATWCAHGPARRRANRRASPVRTDHFANSNRLCAPPSSSAEPSRPSRRSFSDDRASSLAIAAVSTVPSAVRLGWPTFIPPRASTSLFAAAPVAAAVHTKIGGRNTRLRAHTGTAVEASSIPVYE